MARPQAPTLLNHTTEQGVVSIIQGTGLWVVLYKQEPFSLKKTTFSTIEMYNKYQRTTFVSAAPAENLARKLNKQFNTDLFTVAKLL